MIDEIEVSESEKCLIAKESLYVYGTIPTQIDNLCILKI